MSPLTLVDGRPPVICWYDLNLLLFPKIWVTWPGVRVEYMCLFWSIQTFAFLKYSIINTDFVAQLLGNCCCHGNHFVPYTLGVVLVLASKYELDSTTQYWIIAILTEYVTWRCDIDLWPFDLGVMSYDATWVVNPCIKFELYKTYRSRVMTIAIFHWLPA